MKLLSKLVSLFRGEERELFEKISRHVELSIRALEVLVSQECFINTTSCVKIISELEKRGDELSREIYEVISKGAISMPVLNILELLVHKIDDILDEVYILSRELDRLLRHSSNKVVVDRVSKYVSECGSRALESLTALRDLVMNIFKRDVSTFRDVIAKIEKLEEEVDELKDNMLEFLYGSASQMSFMEFYASISVTFMLDNILDRAKDAAELTLLLALSMS